MSEVGSEYRVLWGVDVLGNVENSVLSRTKYYAYSGGVNIPEP